ncbi:MAG: type II/IV secretion system protein, partial [Verrucomicrobiales bacterium]|nr:type II/IV secretion system protein [Verrucomicrobiales bacterium]
CKVPAQISEEQIRQLEIRNPGGICEASATGCDHCGFSGYRGRLAIYELCMITPEMTDLIVSRASARDLAAQAVAQGFEPMQSYGIRKVEDGETSLDEVLAATG